MIKIFQKSKLFILLFVLCIAAFVAAFALETNVANAASGDGTIGSPYEVNTAEDLNQIAEDVNNGLFDGYYGVHFVLSNDIDLAAFIAGAGNPLGWMPIGTVTYPFKGTFDGAGLAIRGLTIENDASDRVGLFGVTGANAVIKNLSVYGSVCGNHYTAGIVGYNQGRIINCKNYATISAKANALHIGGITAYNSGSIVSSFNGGNITLGFSTFVGGIVGSNFGSIENCGNEAELVSVASIIGGIAGSNSSDSTISGAINCATISGKSTIGGIAGNNPGIITNAFNSGLIDSDNGTAGGIAGSNESTAQISYVLSVSDVYGLDDIAAISGYNLGIVKQAFYDNSIFNGRVVNGITPEGSKGLPTYILTHADILTSTSKLKTLTDNNANIWTKRTYSGSDCYYPELKYFYDNADIFSRAATKISRTGLTQNDITLSVTSLIYNGQDRKSDIYWGSVKLEEGQDYAAVYTNNKNAGTAQIDITLINGFSGTAVKTFTITKSELIVEWDDLEFIYNGNDQSPILSITGGLIGAEAVTFKYNRTTSKNADRYNIEAELEETLINANYYLEVTTTEYEVVKADITVEWSAEVFYYNGQVQLHTASVLTGRIGIENITFVYDYDENINAGQQLVTAYLDDTAINANYNFLGDTHSYTINKQPITVVWSDETDLLYYNGLAQYPTVTVSGGKIDNENITFTYSGYTDNINANETDGYFVLMELTETQINANYYLEPINYNYMIYKNPLNIEWWDAPLLYSGDAQSPSFYIVSGRIGDDDIIFDVSDYSQNINASSGGAYQITIALVDNLINANYSFSPFIKIYDIQKATYNPNNNIEFRSQTFSYDGQAKSIFIIGSLPEGVSVEYENNDQTAVGEYIVRAVFTVNPDNYNPLTTNNLSATIYIAQMIFNDSRGITVINTGDTVYGLELNINALSNKSKFKESGKKILSAYGISFTDDVVEITVSLSEKQLKRNGIKVLYKNSSGEIKAAEYKIVDGKLIFTAEDITEFAILGDLNLLPLWIGLGMAVLAAVGVGMFVIKKRRSKALAVAGRCNNAANNSEVLEKPQEEFIKYESNEIVELDEDIHSNDVINNVPFVLDGVHCISYDWFLKSLRFKTISKQKSICGGDASVLQLVEAISQNTVYWLGKRYKRKSRAYETLISRAKEATKGEI